MAPNSSALKLLLFGSIELHVCKIVERTHKTFAVESEIPSDFYFCLCSTDWSHFGPVVCGLHPIAATLQGRVAYQHMLEVFT